MGQLLSAGVLRVLLDRTDLGDWGWRIPYATQWFWPVPIIVGCLLAPESPWWLVRKDRVEDARRVLQGLIPPNDTEYDVDRNLAMMIHTK